MADLSLVVRERGLVCYMNEGRTLAKAAFRLKPIAVLRFPVWEGKRALVAFGPGVSPSRPEALSFAAVRSLRLRGVHASSTLPADVLHATFGIQVPVMW